MSHKPIIKLLTAATLAMLVAIAMTTAALAHANLLRSEPADKAVLAVAPRQMRLWFSEAINTDLSSIRVVDINSRAVQLAGVHRSLTEQGLVIVDLPDLAPGLYSAIYKVLSEDDGHLTQGQFVFGVGNQVNASSMSTAANTASVVSPSEVFLRWLSFCLLAALMGAVTIARFVLVPVEQANNVGTAIRAARRRVLGWAVWCSGLAWVAGMGVLLWQAMAVTGALSGAWQLLRTRWGLLWLIRQSILMVLFAGTFFLHRARLRNDKPIWLMTAWLCLVLALVEALNSHAAALLTDTTLAVGADALHLLAASLWIGGLLALIVGLLPQIARDRQNLDSIVRAGWGPFSRLALVSVCVLAITGLYSMARQVASIDALITTLYGQVLLTKVALMLVVGAIGLLNSMLLHPRLVAPLAQLLHRPSGWTPLALNRLPTLVVIEAGLGLIVLLATGLITSSSPARGPEFAPVDATAFTPVSQPANDLIITFSASPNRPGQNFISVNVYNTRRPAPAPIEHLQLQLVSPADPKNPITLDPDSLGDGRYQVGGDFLNAAGAWHVSVRVSRNGLPVATTAFAWNVLDSSVPTKPRVVLVSDHPLAPILTIAAFILAALGLGTLAALWLYPRLARTAPLRFALDGHRLAALRKE